jgi:hypothetical protein
LGGFLRCYPTIADLRRKAAGRVAIRLTPSYTCGTACGENKSAACSSIGKKPIGNYIADFYAPAARLVVELDGAHHLQLGQATYDAQRTRDLEQHGLRVLRFDDRQVLLQTESVLEMIFQAVKNPS